MRRSLFFKLNWFLVNSWWFLLVVSVLSDVIGDIFFICVKGFVRLEFFDIELLC